MPADARSAGRPRAARTAGEVTLAARTAGHPTRALLERVRRTLRLREAGALRLPSRHVLTAGFFNPVQPYTVQVLGEAAAGYLQNLPPKQRRALPAKLRRRGMAVLIARHTRDCASWQRAGIGCFTSPAAAHAAVHALRRALLDLPSRRKTVHGVLLRVYGLGVLIFGAAGAGKSRLALELVERGHALIADDAVELTSAAPGVLIGHCPPLLRGLLAVRGVGVLDVPRLYGGAHAGRQRVDLAVQLGAGRVELAPGGRRPVRRLLGVALPVLSLAAPLGHNPSVLIEAACRDHWLRLSGHDAGAEFARRQQRAMNHPRI